MNDTIAGPRPVVRRRKRWPLFTAAAVGATASVIGAALLLSSPAQPPVSAACQRATAAQNTFVEDAVAQGYPDVDISTGMAIISADLSLLNKMTAARCAPNTKIEVLPSS